MKTKIVWFRNDLRLNDNLCLTEAIEKSDQVVPVYVFDPRFFGIGKYGFPKTGHYRAQFLIEAVSELKVNLQNRGSDLLIFRGKPEEILPTLALQYQASAIFFSKEVTPEEVEIEDALLKGLSKKNIDWKTFFTSTLIDVENLPFPLQQIPTMFTKFRKAIEGDIQIVSPLSSPKKVVSPIFSQNNKMPDLADFGIPIPVSDERNAFPYKGGENQGVKRVAEYVWEKDLLKEYFETRNGLIGADYSSKFSAWLSIGCLSPRYIYAEVKRYETERIENKSTYWLIFELLWRDFFHLTAAKHYNRFFAQDGYNNAPKREWDDNWEKFEKWKEGKTGQDFVDANMLELKKTGFMSNRGRQNVASYLINDLKVNWLMGAEYFESMLIDHDVCSNYGNWSYLAGIGADPRENRVFNIDKQANEYDPNGEYRRLWLN
jgi:deoxyribodipyrimidine photo-lyase